MTLYGYFRNKAELLDALMDVSVGVTAADLPDSGPWRERISALARTMRDWLESHPALVQVRMQQTMTRPSQFVVTERVVQALIDAGLDRAEAARAFRVVFVYVFGFVAFSDPGAEVTAERRRTQVAVAAGLPPDEFPLLSEMGAEMAETMGGDEQFEYGLDVVIDGLAGRLP
jgi:AcrR family transcriptional regulator